MRTKNGGYVNPGLVLWAFQNWKLVIGIVSVAMALGGGWYMRHKYESMKEDVATYLKDNVTLKKLLGESKETNRLNLATIAALQADKNAAIKSIEELNKKVKADRSKIVSLEKKIDELMKDPLSDGPVALVLSTTMVGVEEMREQRAKEGWK